MSCYCFINGKILPVEKATIHISDLGFLRSYAVFDFLRTYNGKPFRLSDHFARFRNSARGLRLALKYSEKEIKQIIETSNIKDFLKLKLQDQEIIELQEEVKKYKSWLSNQGSVTIFKTITKYDTLYKMIPSELTDSTFLAEISNEWIHTKFGYRSDTTFYNLMVYNKYSVVLGEDKEGFFKKSKSFVEITNLNPYSETTSLRTYQVTQKKKHFSIGPQLGAGITSDLQFNFYIGIGIQYSLIKF